MQLERRRALAPARPAYETDETVAAPPAGGAV